MIIAGLLLLPLFAAFLSPLAVKKISGNRLGWLLAIVPLLMFVLLLSQVPSIAIGHHIEWNLPWFQAMGITFGFRLDGLSQLLLFLICGIGFPIVIYSKPYFGSNPYLGRYYALLFIFMMAMVGAVCANDLMTLFVFWEMTSLCSFLLIGLNHRNRTARKAAIEALFITTLGGLCLLASFILLAQVAGSQRIDVLVTRYALISDHAYFNWILILFLIGAFTKSAQFPFGFWLPGAMRAPTPVSAYLHSATMVQLGIYLLARFHPLFADSSLWFIILTTIGSVTMITSILAAFRYFDMKLLLAHTTVTALGSLVFLLAASHDLAIKAAMSFLLVHALYKANLFMAIGDIQHQTGTRHYKNLSGLHRAMPITFLAVFVAAFSMAGAPPLLGFYVKELVYEASLTTPIASYILTFVVVLANMMMAAIAFILVLNPFGGKQRPAKVKEANVNMSVNALILAVATLLLSFFTGTLNFYILSPATEVILEHPETANIISGNGHTGMRASIVLSIITLSGAVVLYLIKDNLRNLLIKTNVLRWIFPYRILQFILTVFIMVAKYWTSFWQSGYLNRYTALIFLTLFLLFAYAMPGPEFNFSFQLPPLLWGLCAWLILSSASLLMVRRFITGLIGLGAFGLGLAFLFVVQGAPDLAMTQILVEILMVILIVYSLSGLNKWPEIQPETPWHRWSRGGIAVGFGLFIAWLLDAVLAQPFDNNIGRYFIENSLPQGHGRNVVNMILVDFRAMDTLGEAIVLLVAAFGIFSLLQLYRGKEK